MDYFTTKLKRQQIVSFLSRRGIENPHQFLNNLLHFASSGQTLKVYDQNSEYRFICLKKFLFFISFIFLVVCVVQIMLVISFLKMMMFWF